MRDVTHIPPPPLDGLVRQFWFYEGLDLPHRDERMLPDGTFNLTINLREEPRSMFDRDRPDRFQVFRRA